MSSLNLPWCSSEPFPGVLSWRRDQHPPLHVPSSGSCEEQQGPPQRPFLQPRQAQSAQPGPSAAGLLQNTSIWGSDTQRTWDCRRCWGSPSHHGKGTAGCLGLCPEECYISTLGGHPAPRHPGAGPGWLLEPPAQCVQLQLNCESFCPLCWGRAGNLPTAPQEGSTWGSPSARLPEAPPSPVTTQQPKVCLTFIDSIAQPVSPRHWNMAGQRH